MRPRSAVSVWLNKRSWWNIHVYQRGPPPRRPSEKGFERDHTHRLLRISGTSGATGGAVALVLPENFTNAAGNSWALRWWRGLWDKRKFLRQSVLHSGRFGETNRHGAALAGNVQDESFRIAFLPRETNRHTATEADVKHPQTRTRTWVDLFNAARICPEYR